MNEQDRLEAIKILEEERPLNPFPNKFCKEKQQAYKTALTALRLVGEYEEVLRRLIEEVDFVISGGDDPHDACPDCGLAGIGMMRDALAKAKSALEKEKE